MKLTRKLFSFLLIVFLTVGNISVPVSAADYSDAFSSAESIVVTDEDIVTASASDSVFTVEEGEPDDGDDEGNDEAADDPDDEIILFDEENTDAESEEADASIDEDTDDKKTEKESISSEELPEDLPENFYTEYPIGGVAEVEYEEEEEIESVSVGRDTLLRAGELESYYVTPNLPPLRDQSPYGTCWAFATTALAEINLAKDGRITNPDMSELHLAYFLYNTETDPLGGTEGDTLKLGPNVLGKGGRTEFGLATYSRWIGVADESTLSYDQASVANGIGLDGSLAYLDAAHITSYHIEPVERDAAKIAADQHANIKELIKKYGAVGISFYAYNSLAASFDNDVYNYKNNAYYNPKSTSGTNHAVVIVGWDDNFSKDNFATTAPGNGAFLVRNSWRDGTGDDNDYDYSGYFWMSYYEATLGEEVYAGDFSLADDYDNNYQYDGGVAHGSVYSDKTANVFTTHAENGAWEEELKAVSIYTSNSNVDYTIDIYTNLSDPANPESGAKASTTTGTTDFAGFTTIELSNSLILPANTTFSVVVTLTKDGASVPMGREITFTSWGADDRQVYSSSTHIERGQSFSYDGSDQWNDIASYATGNLCIKAYTRNIEASEEVTATDIEISGLTDGMLEIGINESVRVNAKVVPGNASNRNITWSSSNESVATVDDNGIVKGLSKGSAVITASINGGAVTNSLKVNVISKLVGLNLTVPYGITTGSSFVVTANPSPEEYETSSNIQWSTNTPEKVQISPYSQYKAQVVVTAPGPFSVKASLDGITKSWIPGANPGSDYYSYEVDDDNVVTLKWRGTADATSYRIYRDFSSDYETIPADKGEGEYTYVDEYYKGKNVTTQKWYSIGYIISGVQYRANFLVQFGNKHTIEYVLNGGSNSPSNPGKYVDGETVVLQPATAPSERQYFEGWYLDPGFRSKKTSITSSDGNVTLYAHFVDVGIDYDLNASIDYTGKGGVNNANNPNHYTPGVSVTLHNLDSVRGYTFDGWYLDKTFKQKRTALSVADTRSYGNKTLYAKFVPVKITGITMNTNIDDADNEGSDLLAVGDIVTLSAQVEASDLTAADLDYTWEISGESGVVTVLSNENSEQLKIRAEKSGVVTVTARAAADKTKVAVQKFNVSGLHLKGTDRNSADYGNDDDNKLVIATGKNVTVKAQLDFVGVDKTVNWASANPAIASVNSAGRITAKSSGETTITATSASRGIKATMRVSVYDPVTSVTLDKKAIKMGENQTAVLKAVTMPTSASNEVRYSSSNDSVATVDYTTGVVTANGIGTATITALAQDGKKATCTVTVGNAVESIELSSKNPVNGEGAVAVGKTLQMQYAFNGGDRKRQPVNKDVKWIIADSSSSNVAYINEKGVITALKEGWVKVIARSLTSEDGSQYVDSFAYKVNVYVPLQKAALNNSSVAIAPEKTFTLKAVLTPAVVGADTVTGSAVLKDAGQEITWTLKNPEDAARLWIGEPSGDGITTTGATCKITARDDGTNKKAIPVTATFTPYGAKKATVLTCNVTVSAAAITKVANNPSSLKLNRGMEGTITANLTPLVPAEAGIVWTVDNSEAVRFVKENGELADSVTTEAGAESGNTVRIRALENNAGAKATVYATTVGTNAKGVQLKAKTTITIGNEAKAIQLMNGKNPANWDGHSRNLVEIDRGKSVTLKATVIDSNNAKAGNQKVNWESSETSVATVNDSGKVTAVRTGYTWITATSQDAKYNSAASARALVYVYNATTKVTLDKTKATLGTYNSRDQLSYREYDVVTAHLTPTDADESMTYAANDDLTGLYSDDPDGKNYISWTVNAGSEGNEYIAVSKISTAEINSHRNAVDKQRTLKELNNYTALYTGYKENNKEGFRTGKGESLAIKALRPGTVKLTARTANGKTAVCTITVYTHVSDAAVKLDWNGQDKTYNNPVVKTVSYKNGKVSVKKNVTVLKESASDLYDYEMQLDPKTLKSYSLKAMLNYDGGVDSEILYSDKNTPDLKLLTARYNAVKKLAVDSNVSFRSSNPSVATVTAKGAVTAKKAGTTVITMTTADGEINKKIIVYVRSSASELQ